MVGASAYARAMPDARGCAECTGGYCSSDAKRPCSTCIRSHAYAVAHAPSGIELPSHPECTFDESSEPCAPDSQDLSPKNRFERLESRINELEALLQEKDRGDGSRSSSTSAPDHSKLPVHLQGFNDGVDLDSGSFLLDLSAHIEMDHVGTIGAFVTDHQHNARDTALPFNDLSTSDTASPHPDFGMEVLHSGWPKNLPGYPFLRHLTEAFFNFTPLASRMFHVPTFLASLSLPPNHPDFPLPATLHAICAMGSIYTAAVAPTPTPPLPAYCDNGIPALTSPETNSFAELQVQAARDAIEHSLRTSVNLFGITQEACRAFAVALRYAVPCGLSTCPPFESVACASGARTAIGPAAKDIIEDETRRNTFWVVYMMERHFASMNNFAMQLDDEDVAQMLPVRGDQFERGILVPPSERQWSFEPNIIEHHLESQIDSFIIYVKATILLSKIKVFNTRYLVKRHLGDPAMQPNPAGIPGMPIPNLIQSSPAFVELDRLLLNFKQSLPARFRDPLADGVLDMSLFAALTTAHFGVILLHEGHAKIGRPGCISSCKVLAAARGILNLLYEAYSTSHNLALLGVYPMSCWYAAGRVMVRFLKAAIEAASEEHIATLQAEVNFFRSVITAVGDSVPYAFHYGRMLDSFLIQVCGSKYATPLSPPMLPTRHKATPESNILPHTVFEDFAAHTGVDNLFS
ncbi:hypothetical protein C8Q77DRAFT_1214178 [Trametes polyzona]|nr:hypothetical protein C8Q77DRAFT_1214178 [Trametes polyzona]